MSEAWTDHLLWIGLLIAFNASLMAMINISSDLIVNVMYLHRGLSLFSDRARSKQEHFIWYVDARCT